MAAPDPIEADRIRQVYDRYDQKGWAESKWADTNPGNARNLQERERRIGGLLVETGYAPLAGRRLLEIGCGSGKVMRSLLRLGARPENCYGVDLIPDRIGEAQAACPGVHFQAANAEQLPFETGSFHLVAVFTVFSSILDDATARRIAGEMDRVLKPGGAVIWYDLRVNNPGNPNVRGLRPPELARLFPEYRPRLCKLTLVPPLARRLGSLTGTLYPILVAMPLLRTHLGGVLMKP